MAVYRQNAPTDAWDDGENGFYFTTVSTSSRVVLDDLNVSFVFVGTGLVFSGSSFTSGTLTGIQMHNRSVSTSLPVMEMSGLSVSAVELGSPLADPALFFGRLFSLGLAGPDSVHGSPTNDELLGLGGDDLVFGYGGNDLIAGYDGDDLLVGGDGRDIMAGNDGDDTILGGADSDVVTFPTGPRSAFSVAKVGTNFVVSASTGLEGSDTLNSVETIVFMDRAFSLANVARSSPPDFAKDKGFLFDEVYYVLANPELAPTVRIDDSLLANPALIPTVTLEAARQHFFDTGALLGKRPTSWFDPGYYENKWADLKAAHLDDATLFAHYNLYGVWEGRSAGPKFDAFDGPRYLRENPDVAEYVNANIEDFLGSVTNGAIAHYVIYGAGEQRVAHDTGGQLVDLGYVV